MAKVLIVGSGGREHALGWKLKQSPKVSELFFLPGNGGTINLGTNIDIKASDNQKIIEWSEENEIDLVVVAPDDPLANGLVDDLTEAGIRAFGPDKKAAEIEWSKAFAKKLMVEEGISTAKAESFNSFAQAVRYVKSPSLISLPTVIKASGLALGKGVMIGGTVQEDQAILQKLMIDNVVGDAAKEVVIEEYLEGFEISIHAFSDGETYSIFPTSQDHKPIFDGDKGPNTGGMGVIAPVPKVDQNLIKRIENEIIRPTLDGLKKRGRIYKGILYPGIMVTKSGPKVLEFNARFGDPEAQSYMRLLKTDLFDIFNACVDGKLKDAKIEWENKFACTIVLASKGYPGDYQKGFEIKGIDDAEKQEDIVVFHAGTKIENGKLVTNGGRVLEVSAIGDSLDEALKKAYKAVKKIKFKGMQYRKDIGKRENRLYN